MTCELKCPCYHCADGAFPNPKPCAHHSRWKPSPWEGCDCSQCEQVLAEADVAGFIYDTREEEERDRELAGFNEPERWVERKDYA